MANFNNDVGLSPNFGLTVEQQPKTETLNFGDGFEQRLTEGLNQNPRKLSLIFENITESSVTRIKDLVERAILFFETRITLENIEVLAEEVNDGLIQIQLEYTIRTTNTRSNFVYPFYFQEGTNVSV